jgi:hypothetical protein
MLYKLSCTLQGRNLAYSCDILPIPLDPEFEVFVRVKVPRGVYIRLRQFLLIFLLPSL